MESITSKLTEALFTAIRSGTDIYPRIPEIKMNLVSKFNYLQMEDIVLFENSIISTAYENLLKNIDISERTNRKFQ